MMNENYASLNVKYSSSICIGQVMFGKYSKPDQKFSLAISDEKIK